MQVCTHAETRRGHRIYPLSLATSPPMPTFEVGVSPEPGAHISWLDWKPQSHSNPSVSASLRAGVTGICRDAWPVMWMLICKFQSLWFENKHS